MSNVFCDQLSLLTTSMDALSIDQLVGLRSKGTRNTVGTSDPKVSFVFAQQQPTAVTSSHSSSAPLKEKQVEKQSSCSSQTTESVDNCRIWNDLQDADAEILFKYGNKFLEGRQGSSNPQLAFQCYSRAASLGHSPSMTALGRMWEKGIGREKNFEEAFNWYLQAAKCPKEPDQLAMLKVAYYLDHGISTSVNKEKAEIWYVELTKRNHPVGILSRLPETLKGLLKADFTKMESLCESAMKRGSLRAQGALGAICLIRCNTNLSLKNRGTQLLIKSTQRGDPFAMMNFGSIYKIGVGIFADLTLARTWHLRAIEFGKSKLVPMMADMTAYDDSIGKARQVDFTAADEKGKEVSTSLDRLGEILGVFHEAYNGKIKAIVELGRIFQQGTEVPQDTVCAEKLFQIAADRGELFALCYLGKPGIVRLQKLSLEGNLVATFSLALAFARGIGCEKNENEATRLLLQLLSHCKLLLLGYWSSKSTPSKVKKEIVMIKDLLKKEMDEGRLLQNDLPDQLMNVVNNMMLAFEDQPHAIHLLGVEFETGESVPKDIVFAVKLYEKAAELKDSHAMIHLASLYENGQGVPQDISKAISYLNNACDLNNASAMNILGNMYEFGTGVKVDEALAAKLYLRAVALSSPEGMTNLGVLYAEGRGVLKDFKKAKMLLEEAVKRKDPQAMYSLAMLLLREGDVAKASRYILDLLKDSASLENPAAMYQLGCLYREGKIVEKDEDQASEYFAHAASLGRADASQKLCELYTQVDEN